MGKSFFGGTLIVFRALSTVGLLRSRSTASCARFARLEGFRYRRSGLGGRSPPHTSFAKFHRFYTRNMAQPLTPLQMVSSANRLHVTWRCFYLRPEATTPMSWVRSATLSTRSRGACWCGAPTGLRHGFVARRSLQLNTRYVDLHEFAPPVRKGRVLGDELAPGVRHSCFARATPAPSGLSSRHCPPHSTICSPGWVGGTLSWLTVAARASGGGRRWCFSTGLRRSPQLLMWSQSSPRRRWDRSRSRTSGILRTGDTTGLRSGAGSLRFWPSRATKTANSPIRC